MKNIGIIGAGNMGSAIISGIYKSNKVRVAEKDKAKAKGVQKKFHVKVDSIAAVVRASDIVILAAKPQDFDALLSEIQSLVKGKLIISIAAGITTLYIEKRLGKARVVRTMPNLPAQVKKGVTGLCKGRFATSADLKLAQNIFNQIGQTIILNEKMIDAVTAVSGSGPAYVFLFVECFEKAAKQLGFKGKLANDIVRQTIRGSLDLLDAQKEEASVLRERVTSKGGTTQAALNVFFKYNIEKIFSEALKAAQKRAKELSR